MAVALKGPRRDRLRAEIARRFLAGPITIKDLAARYERRPTMVRRLLEEAGITSDRHLLGFTDDEVASELAARYNRGTTVEELVAVTGIEERRVRRCVRDAGLNRHLLQLPMSLDELAAAYDSGYSIAQLAEQVGTHYGTMRNVLLRAGVKMRPAGVGNRRPD